MTANRQSLKVRVAAPEAMITIDASSAEHGMDLSAQLVRMFGLDRVLTEEEGKKIVSSVPWARISEFWALVNELSRRCDFVINYTD